VEIRPYGDSDLPWLQHAMAGWIAEAGRCGYDHIGELPHRIYENLRGLPRDELVHVWSSGADVEAVSICLRFGVAFDVFLAPRWRGTEVEARLLRQAVATTAVHMGPSEEYVVTDVFSCDTDRMSALAALGFERYRTWDLVRELSPLSDVAFDVPAGFVVRAARLDDADGLAAARNASFDTDWTGASYLSEVMEKPGYDPDREIIAVAPDGRVAAYTVYWTDERNRLGHFEPVGTHRDFRRLGLARAVMAAALARMRSAGMRSASVNHNEDNAGAGRLYESLGFEVKHRTYGYRSTVENVRRW
jgi:ribosomal protein S18 acetylase RimI-like enzyme